MTPRSSPVYDGAAAPAPSCPEGYQSITPGWIVEGPGPLGGFDLELDRERYEKGDELVAELRNVTDEERVSGNKSKFDLQYRGEAGWHTVFGTPEGPVHAWTSEGIVHQPGDGFTWQLTLTREGLSEGVEPGPSYHACQPVKPGTYRFVYWGITTEKEREADYETDYALGVPFAVSEP